MERYYPSPASARRGSVPLEPRSVRSTRAQAEAGAAAGMGAGKYLLEMLLYLVAFVAANMVWVFSWAFLDDHLLTWSYELSNWCCVLVALPLEFALNFASTEVRRMIAGFLVLFASTHSHSSSHLQSTHHRHQVAGGVYLDGTGEGASGFYFPIWCVRRRPFTPTYADPSHNQLTDHTPHFPNYSTATAARSRRTRRPCALPRPTICTASPPWRACGG